MVLILAWGSTFASIKVSLEGCPPMLLAGGRCVIGGALVALVAVMLERRPGLRGNLAPYAALALLNVIGFFGLQTLAIDHLPSGYASLLLYLQPVLTVLLAAPLGEALTPARLVGALTAFVGVAVVSFHPDRTVTTVGIALGPVVAVALGWWLLDETVGWSLVIGTVLVCAGVLLVNVTTTPQAGAGTSDEDPVATGRQR